MAARKARSTTFASPVTEIEFAPREDELVILGRDRVRGVRELQPSHFAFGQLAGFAGAPASYLRKLPAPLTAINLKWSLDHAPVRTDGLFLAEDLEGDNPDVLRSITSTSYGRIWDQDVVEAVQRVNQDGRWHVPAASYSTTNPRRATTLYASDRDVFVFLVDDETEIDVGDRAKLHRGFIAWNSEVGDKSFGLTTFLYNRVCDNRIIWGATEVQELRIRHTGGAPERFIHEGARYLERYAQERGSLIEEPIRKAQAFELDRDDRQGDGWSGWLRKKGFTAPEAKRAVEAAKAEEGEDRSLWDIVQGLTASARSITHTDDRVDLERRAGKLLDIVS